MLDFIQIQKDHDHRSVAGSIMSTEQYIVKCKMKASVWLNTSTSMTILLEKYPLSVFRCEAAEIHSTRCSLAGS